MRENELGGTYHSKIQTIERHVQKTTDLILGSLIGKIIESKT